MKKYSLKCKKINRIKTVILLTLLVCSVILVTNDLFGKSNINTAEAAEAAISAPVVTVNPKVAYLYHKLSGNTPLITEEEAMVGVSAYDSLDGDITNKITIDKLDIFYSNAAPGQYSIQYNVRNSSGISGYMSRSYQVGYEPQIFANNVTKKIGENVSESDFEPSATNFSNQAVDVNSDFSKVNFNMPGTYPVTFSSRTGKPYATEESDIIQYKTVYLTLIGNQNKVTVEYIDTAGNTIAENIVYTGNIGQNYETKQKEVEGYTFKEVKGNPAGTFIEEDQTVTYVYTKNLVVGGTVTARYVDESGNPIAENTVFTGNIGESYKIEQKEITGYTFKEVHGNPNGTFTESEQTVTYVYTKNPTVRTTVIAKYVDENGNSIADSMIYTGKLGETYTTEQISIDSYTFLEVQGNPTGTFTEEEQTITYIYKKNKKETNNHIVPSDNDQLPKKNETSNQKLLPKAGEKENSVLTIVGVLLLSLLLLFSFYSKEANW